MSNMRKVGTHLTREKELIDLFKDKPETLNVRAIGGIDLIDAKSGDIVESVEAENLYKDGLLKMAKDVLYRYSSFRNHNSIIPNKLTTSTATDISEGYAINRMYLINDPENNETPKASLKDGKIVGWVDLAKDYGGSSATQGSRNKPRSYAFYDEDTNEIVVRITAIFDETRINGETVNKLALGVRYNNLEWNTGRGYRELTNPENDDASWAFRTTSILSNYGTDVPTFSSEEHKQNLYRSHGKYISYLDFKGTLAALKVCSISDYDDQGSHGSKSDTIVALSDLKEHYRDSNTLWYRISNEDFMIADFGTTDTGNNAVRFKKYLHDTPLDDSNSRVISNPDSEYVIEIEGYDGVSRIAVVVDGANSMLLYTFNGTLRATTFDYANGIVSGTVDTGITVLPTAVSKVRDGLFLARIVTDQSPDVAQNMTVGYMDIDNNRFLEVGSEISVEYFNEKTAWLYGFNEDGLINAYYPIDYAPPASIVHIDSLVPITKDSTQQLAARYEIRLGKDLHALPDPFLEFDEFPEGGCVFKKTRNFVPKVGNSLLTALSDVGTSNQNNIVIAEGSSLYSSGSTTYALVKRVDDDLYILMESDASGVYTRAILSNIDWTKDLYLTPLHNAYTGRWTYDLPLTITSERLSNLVSGDGYVRHRIGSTEAYAGLTKAFKVTQTSYQPSVSTTQLVSPGRWDIADYVIDALTGVNYKTSSVFPKKENSYVSMQGEVRRDHVSGETYIVSGMAYYSNSFSWYVADYLDVTDMLPVNLPEKPLFDSSGNAVAPSIHMFSGTVYFRNKEGGVIPDKWGANIGLRFNNSMPETFTVELALYVSGKYYKIGETTFIMRSFTEEDFDKVTVTSVERMPDMEYDSSSMVIKVKFNNDSGALGWGLSGSSIKSYYRPIYNNWNRASYYDNTCPINNSLEKDTVIIAVNKNDEAHDINLALKHMGTRAINDHNEKPITISVPAA